MLSFAHFVPDRLHFCCVTQDITPVWTAASNGHAETVKVLIDAKADVNRPNNEVIRPCVYHHLLILFLIDSIGAVLHRI